jgi:hypothetical protein
VHSSIKHSRLGCISTLSPSPKFRLATVDVNRDEKQAIWDNIGLSGEMNDSHSCQGVGFHKHPCRMQRPAVKEIHSKSSGKSLLVNLVTKCPLPWLLKVAHSRHGILALPNSSKLHQ